MFFKFIIVPLIVGIVGFVGMHSFIACYQVNRFLAAVPIISLFVIVRVICVFMDDHDGTEAKYVYRVQDTAQTLILGVVLYVVYLAVLLMR